MTFSYIVLSSGHLYSSTSNHISAKTTRNQVNHKPKRSEMADLLVAYNQEEEAKKEVEEKEKQGEKIKHLEEELQVQRRQQEKYSFFCVALIIGFYNEYQGHKYHSNLQIESLVQNRQVEEEAGGEKEGKTLEERQDILAKRTEILEGKVREINKSLSIDRATRTRKRKIQEIS